MNNHNELRDKVDLFASKWKSILLCLIIAMAVAFVYLRYATYEYEAKVSIKINDDKQSKKMPEISTLQDYGLFSKDFTNITDEIEVIKSRALITQVVEELNLNLKFYERGNIKEQEVYVNPPVILNFFENDSIIKNIDTTLYLKVKSPTKFTISKDESNELLDIESNNATEYAFGDRIKTGFGDLVITPNVGRYVPKIGSSIKLTMTPLNLVIDNYQQNINVSPAKEGSSILHLSLKENIAEKAKMILDKLVEKYNEDVVSDKLAVVKTTSDFINNRLDIVSNELENVDFTAETLQKNNRLTALSSQSDIFLQSEKENEIKQINTTNQIQMIDYMKEYLSDNNSNSDLLPVDVGIADNSVSQITKSHNELVLQRNRLLKTSTERNPTVVNLDNQIASLKSNLEQSLSNIKSTNQITLNNLNREDARINSQIYSAPTKARQFRDITRQQNIKESLYLYLLQKREETAISLGISSPNAKIIDTAYSQSKPVSPKKTFVYLAAILLGMSFPMGIIYLKDMLDTKIHNKADLQKVLSAPFLGEIPLSDKKRRIISKIDYSPKAEAFRIIRSNIDFMLKGLDKECKTLFVTSTTSQEGKSHTSVNLATSLSYSEKKVLLIETDIRVPKIGEYLKIDTAHGLTDYISDKSLTINDVTVSLEGNPYLDVIPSGTIPPNPAELLMQPRVKELFKQAENNYEYIVVDTAAVGLVTDTLLLSQLADMFIYVVSANNIDKRQLYVAQSLYTEGRLPNMALLLNGSLQKKGYGYGYGSSPTKKKGWLQHKK